MNSEWQCRACGAEFSAAGDAAPACSQCGSSEVAPREDEAATMLSTRPSNPEPEQRTIDGCRIERRLGRGGMGEVWLGYEEFADRWVAIKTIRPEFTADESILLRFRNEVRACAKIRSNHVVQLFASGELPEGGLFMRMEFVEGESLADARLREPARRVPIDKALRWMRDAAIGLRDAEKVAIVHRDIKPANLLLHKDGHVLVADFGIALLTDAAVRLTQDNTVPGTAIYMAPELFDGAPSSVQSDVYSLGATLFELLSGRPPTDGTTIGDIYRHKREQDELSLEGMAFEGVDAGLVQRTDALLRRMTAKDVARRPASFAEVVAELDALLGAGNTMPVPPPVAAGRRGAGWIVPVAALAVVGIGLLWWQSRDREPSPAVVPDSGEQQAAKPAEPELGGPDVDGPKAAEPERKPTEQPAANETSTGERPDDKRSGDAETAKPQPVELPDPPPPSNKDDDAVAPEPAPQPVVVARHVEWLASWSSELEGAKADARTALPTRVRDQRRGAEMCLVSFEGAWLYVDREEVSWRQWRDAELERPDAYRSDDLALPARGVDAEQMRAFAERFDLSLPTFEQWRQVTYGDGRDTPWGERRVQAACNGIGVTNGRADSDQSTNGELQRTDSDFETCRAPFRMLVSNVREVVRVGDDLQTVGVGYGTRLPAARFGREVVGTLAFRPGRDVGLRCVRRVPDDVERSARRE